MAKKKICPECWHEFEGKGKYCSSKCSAKAVEEAARQLRKKEGPIFEKWKSRLKASISTL